MENALHNLSSNALRTLAGLLRDGPLSKGVSQTVLSQSLANNAASVNACLENMIKQGMLPKHIALVIDAIVDARERSSNPQLLFDLVLSGPEIPGIPTADTYATFQNLVESAQTEIVMVGYAVHNGKRLFRRLAERMDESPSLQVILCLDIARKQTDTSLVSEIVRRFAFDFANKHWPGKRKPEIFYDSRALAQLWEERASLHAKCVIVDRCSALVTSANFTEAAQHKNIEAGVLIRHEPFVTRLSNYFEAMRNSGQFKNLCF